MRFATTSGAAVLLALAPRALALGTATLVNQCDFDIYYAPTFGTNVAASLLAPGGSFSAAYSMNGVGVSIKVSGDTEMGHNITQFEYTWAAADTSIYYDISHIDGNPFSQDGSVIVPTMTDDPANPTCEVVHCPAGVDYCSVAYNLPDDQDTKVCDQEASLVMTVCSGASYKEKREPEAVPSHSEPEVLHSHQHRAHVRHFPRK